MVVSKNIDPLIAAQLGFPKPHYTVVERERRWICHTVPRQRITHTQEITDLYVTETGRDCVMRNRLWWPRNVANLTRKADIDAHTRLLSSIYLSQESLPSSRAPSRERA